MVDTAKFARLRDHSSDQVLKTKTVAVAPISAGGSLKPVDLSKQSEKPYVNPVKPAVEKGP